ncbi:MAG: ORF6C domain-containing protein [Terrisporobacter sp.]|uniref:ORF6C domain-containing protein n=1 Tax=Terrisporobacter sp. TaxID=1965305 RepID=UPI00399A2DAD
MSDLYNSYKVLKNNEGQAVQTIPSYEVAEMMEVEHAKVLRMIEGDKTHIGIIPALRKAQLGVSEYFIESTYKVENNNKIYKCYECTKLGCDMLANKMTGEKGIVFTARYVKKFNEMIEDPYKGISTELRAILMLDKKQQEIEKRVTGIENKMTIDYELAENLRNAISSRAVYLLGGKYTDAYKKLSKKLFAEFHKGLKTSFKVNSYKNIAQKNYDDALKYIENWKPSEMLVYAIQGLNGQLSFEY